MALDYGKMEFAVSFKPITAFPLDSRSYYESLTDAQDAAATAVEAGSDQGTLYYGQTLCVYNKKEKTAAFYIIQPPPSDDEGSLPYLEPVGAQAKMSSDFGLIELNNDTTT